MKTESQTLGKRLQSLRRSKHLSQKELAAKLHISFQSVSKWECDESLPGVSMLPALADILEVNCDTLLGHSIAFTGSKYYEIYKKDAFFWSTQPNDLSYMLIKHFPPMEYFNLLEIGCGEGRDAVFFGMNGYNVTAFDIVQTGIDKGRALSRLRGAPVNFLCANMRSFTSAAPFDMVYGYRILHYLKPGERAEVIEQYKAATRDGGINAYTVFVKKPFIAEAPDNESDTYLYNSGELFGYFSDWEIIYINEEIIDCNSSGVPHRHVVDSVIAKKPESGKI